MTRILTGGGKDSAGNPTNKTVGRPGMGSVARGTRQSARVLSKSDPADGILNTPISDVTNIDRGYATLATALGGTNDDLVFTAKMAGTIGNTIRVRYVVAGNDTPLTVAVSGTDITVNVATSGAGAATSTAAQVMAAVNASAAASALVTASLKTGNDGTGVVAALAYTALAGGDEGEMRKALPPELAAGPSAPTISGKEEQTITNPDIALTATVRRPAGTGTNRRIRKR